VDARPPMSKDLSAMTLPDSADEVLPLGSLVGGRYRLEGSLGSGGMGTVYSASSVSDGRRLALKIIRREHTEDSTMVARFQREGRLISTIRHPNIVEVFELDEADGSWFIAMELLEGMNLGTAMASKGTYDPGEALPVLLGILDALAVAHAQQIVHRDIRPENVFLVARADRAPHVKVLDFGVAKVVGLSAQEQLTRSGMVLGTPEFMAPEQAVGTSVDHRSDLYSVGCVGYAMLCGRPPFVDNWPLRVIMKQAFEPHVPPSRLRPDLPAAAAVDKFMGRALEKKPADRYQSATEMRADLATLVSAAS
jgi:serine/threonine-protein kinase